MRVHLCALLLFLFTAELAAQSIPDTVTPGGVTPENEADIPPLISPESESTPLLPEPEPIAVPLADDTAETVPVQKIVLLGARDDKKHGVSLQELNSLIDRQLQQTQNWSLARLNQLAAEITNYYREKDLILSQALVLEQSLQDGEAEITVLEGVIGEVHVEGSRHIKDRVVESLFYGITGKPSTRQAIESALLYASDLPGVTGRGVLQRGALPGTADLAYQISRDKRFEFYLNGDNYGSEFVGENRLRADLVINNPLKRGDRLTLSGLTAFNPSNNDYFGFDYSKPFVRKSNGKPVIWGISGSHNEFSVGGALAEFEIEGESTRFDTYLAYPYRRGYRDNRTWSLALSGKRSEVFQRQLQSSEDKLTILTLKHLWNRRYQRGLGGSLSINATLSHGFDDFLGSMPKDSPTSSRLGSSGSHAGGDFDKLNLSINWQHRLGRWLNLQARLSAQESSDLLVSLEQFPLGGPNSVRAYPLSSFLTDSGLFLSTELQANVTPRLQLSLFGDYGEGDLNEPLGADVADVDLAGFGVGLRTTLFKRFSILGSIAKPSGSIPEGAIDETQYYLSIGTSFN